MKKGLNTASAVDNRNISITSMGIPLFRLNTASAVDNRNIEKLWGHVEDILASQYRLSGRQ